MCIPAPKPRRPWICFKKVYPKPPHRNPSLTGQRYGVVSSCQQVSMSQPNQPLARVFINSLPKSGTHLLAKTVELFGYREHFAGEANLDDLARVTPLFINYREVKDALSREQKQPAASACGTVAVGTLTPVYVDPTTFAQWLDALAPGQYLLGHVMYSPALRPLLADLGYRHLFILRDPRAVVVSLLDFILETRGMPRPHFLQADFRTMTAQARLDFILQGGSAPLAGVTTQGFAAVYRALLAWEADPDCLVLRFEDLVGPQGGGSAERQHATIASIASHLGHSVDEAAAHLATVFDPTSRTFRTGQIDGWQSELDAVNLAHLNAYCAPLCQAAGYEVIA